MFSLHIFYTHTHPLYLDAFCVHLFPQPTATSSVPSGSTMMPGEVKQNSYTKGAPGSGAAGVDLWFQMLHGENRQTCPKKKWHLLQ